MIPNSPSTAQKIVLTFSGIDSDLDIRLESEGLGENLEMVALYLERTISTLFDSNYYTSEISDQFPSSLERTIVLTYSGQPEDFDITMVSTGFGEDLESIAVYLHRTIEAILASEEQLV
ncbi:MAG: hypothetical protein H9W81_08315 [Enterococcus sp.]|nr:hypothetical protein [Enterococcus sp.]